LKRLDTSSVHETVTYEYNCIISAIVTCRTGIDTQTDGTGDGVGDPGAYDGASVGLGVGLPGVYVGANEGSG
jgi:hypothetical protein